MANDVVEFFKDHAGEYRWRRKDAETGNIISGPEEGFPTRERAKHNARRANSDVPEDEWVDSTGE